MDFAPDYSIGKYIDPITVFSFEFGSIGLSYKLGNHYPKVDISYEIFVWHMPVLTMLAQVSSISQIKLIFISLVTTVLISLLCNFTIAKRMAIKNEIKKWR